MRPGTEHIVYTVEDAIARGGHFYTHHTLTRSLFVGIRESLHGRTSTNDTYLTAETVFHKIMRHYYKQFEIWKRDKVPGECLLICAKVVNS
jgi:hypothetical protein